MADKSYLHQCQCVNWLIHDNRNADVNFVHDNDVIKQEIKRKFN